MGALINWLWQGSAVVLAATLVLRASHRMSATTRYRLWWVTMAIVLLLPLLSLERSVQTVRPQAFAVESGGSPRDVGTASPTPRTVRLVLPAVPSWLSALCVFGWSVWVALSLSRTLGALATLRRVKRSSRPFPIAREARLHTWRALRVRGRRAHLVLSDEVRAAAVLGLASPSIAVAPVVLDALNDRELDQIVVHEWAHVYRRDDITRLVQRLIVSIAGVHPAVWWINRQLHLERETACDDWAVNSAGSARALALCLTKLASLPGGSSDPLLVPAALRSSELTTRVVRLLDGRRNTSTAPALATPLFIVFVVAALGAALASADLVVTSPIAAAAPPNVSRPAAAPEEPVTLAASQPGAQPAVDRPLPKRPRASHASVRPPRRPAITTGSIVPARTAAAAVGRVANTPPDDALRELVRPDGPALLPTPLAALLDDRWLTGADLPGTTSVVADAPRPTQQQEAAVRPLLPEAAKSPTVWGAAADAGVTVGRSSQKAAVATAGFATRLSKSIASVF